MKKQTKIPNLLILSAILTLAFVATGCGVTNTPEEGNIQTSDVSKSENTTAETMDTVLAGSDVATSQNDSDMAADAGTGSMMNNSGSGMMDSGQMGSNMMNQFKDGTYTVTGSYVSPEGGENLGVTLTLQDGLVTDASIEVMAHDKVSIGFQKMFSDGFKSQVIGKKITDVNVGKVSGSSLTPIGFNDAVNKIEVKAAS